MSCQPLERAGAHSLSAWTVTAFVSLSVLLGCDGSLGPLVELGIQEEVEPSRSGGDGDTCRGGTSVSAKRLVRLSFNQVANSLGTLIDVELGARITEEFELLDAQNRAFPPLQSPREGNSFTDQSWARADSIAKFAGDHVLSHIETETGCGAEPSDECALSYLTDLAEKAYRRPLTNDELTRFSDLYENLRGAEGSTPTSLAIQYGVYAIFQSPHFLYRTEFGMDPRKEGPLTSSELASMLSYFLTDDTPDAELLEAARTGGLSDAESIGAHVDRILVSDAARANLHGAMISYLAYPNLASQVIQDEAFTGAMRDSMYREAEIFLDRALWSEGLDALLISRTGFVNETLAPIYGFESFPPAGAIPVPGVDGFFEVALPANRTGLLTQPGFLANRSRPDHTSVVGRGLLIQNAFLCTETPAPPDAVIEDINEIVARNPDATERELAEIRMSTTPCANCHLNFDAYGLALDSYDVLGRFRTVDSHGRPIDTSVTLPEQVGGENAADILEVADKLAASGAFGRCMGQNLINYALADVSAGAATIQACAVDAVAQAFAKTDGTFPSLVKVVAMSKALSERSAEGDQ